MAPGEVRLQLELRWRDSVLTSKGFSWHVEAGPSRRFMFPLEGFACDPEGYGLALREGDSFLVTPPPGAGRPVRLSEGMRAEFHHQELKLRAWVTREPQAGSLDWLWLVGGALGLAALYQLVKSFGVFFAVLLLLLPHPKPSRFTDRVLAAKAAEPKRAVKVRPFVPELKPPPLPEKPSERLKLLAAGKRSAEIFKAAGKKQAERERRAELKSSMALFKVLGAPGELKMVGVLGRLSARDDHADLLAGGTIGGVIAGVQGDSFGAGGLGLSGTGTGGGGRGEGLGLGGFGTLGHARQLERNPAEEEARTLARDAGTECFGEEEGRVLMRVTIDASGTVTANPVTTTAPPAVVECLKQRVRAWRLPATPEGGHVTLVFRGRR